MTPEIVALYRTSAQEDIELAELGLNDYVELLATKST
jgi:hypothetical protein